MKRVIFIVHIYRCAGGSCDTVYSNIKKYCLGEIGEVIAVWGNGKNDGIILEGVL